jgi:hypothetical protein
MVGEQIKTMLEKQMETSEQFTKENFGLQLGDGYPEMVREIVKSDKISMRLILGLTMGVILVKGIRESLEKAKEGEKMNLTPVIIKNLSAFDTPLSMLYWGIQIGRQLERQQAEALKGLEQ